MTFNAKVISRLKKELNIKKDLDLAQRFKISPSVFSSWKRSKGKLIEGIVKYGMEENLDLNAIFETHQKQSQVNSIPILMAEDLFAYYLNPEETLKRAKLASFPRMVDEEVGFQVFSSNMAPALKVSSFVFGKKEEVRNLISDQIYVLHMVKKGVYIARFKKKMEEILIFENDNDQFPDIILNKKDLLAIFKVTRVLSDTGFF